MLDQNTLESRATYVWLGRTGGCREEATVDLIYIEIYIENSQSFAHLKQIKCHELVNYNMMLKTFPTSSKKEKISFLKRERGKAVITSKEQRYLETN